MNYLAVIVVVGVVVFWAAVVRWLVRKHKRAEKSE